MKKLLLLPLFVCSLSFTVNMIPSILGLCTQTFDSISLISSTISFFSLLLTLYFIATETTNKAQLKNINIAILISIIFPIYDIVTKTSINIASASAGLMPAIDQVMNYGSRILLVLIPVSYLLKKATMLRISLIAMSSLVFISFIQCVNELIKFINITDKPSVFHQFSTILNPICILLFFLLFVYVISNKDKIEKLIG